MNHMIHIAAVTQLRLDTDGRAYYRRKRSEGKKPLEAIRCLKRRISDAIYRQLVADAEQSLSRQVRVREGTAGRHSHPARSTSTRSSTLRISHFPDPRNQRYARTQMTGRARCKRPVDDRGEPEGRRFSGRPRRTVPHGEPLTATIQFTDLRNVASSRKTRPLPRPAWVRHANLDARPPPPLTTTSADAWRANCRR